jgi:hypothetical protein
MAFAIMRVLYLVIFTAACAFGQSEQQHQQHKRPESRDIIQPRRCTSAVQGRRNANPYHGCEIIQPRAREVILFRNMQVEFTTFLDSKSDTYACMKIEEVPHPSSLEVDIYPSAYPSSPTAWHNFGCVLMNSSDQFVSQFVNFNIPEALVPYEGDMILHLTIHESSLLSTQQDQHHQFTSSPICEMSRGFQLYPYKVKSSSPPLTPNDLHVRVNANREGIDDSLLRRDSKDDAGSSDLLRPVAFATLLYGDGSYLPGVLALASSLRATATQHALLCLVKLDETSSLKKIEIISALKAANITIIIVDDIGVKLDGGMNVSVRHKIKKA